MTTVQARRRFLGAAASASVRVPGAVRYALRWRFLFRAACAHRNQGQGGREASSASGRRRWSKLRSG